MTSCSVVPLHLGEVLGDGLAGDGHAVAVEVAALEQRLHHQRDAAGLEQVLGDVFSARLEVADVGRLAEDLADVEQVELDARLMRHRRQMQRRVGRAAGGGDGHRGILERLAGHDLARTELHLEQFHHLLAGSGAEGVADFVGRRGAAAIGQREADGLGDHGHGVGGVLAAARAGGGAGDALELVERLVVHLADRMEADGLEQVLHDDVAAAEAARQDRAAIDEDRRHVEADHRHHHAGQATCRSRPWRPARHRSGRAW